MTSVVALTREEAEALVYHECQLLDERCLDEWLELFTDDGVYWLPTSEPDRPEAASAIYDDAIQRKKRVHQILREPRLAQTPPSRTVHMVSNLQIDQGSGSSEATVQCNLLVAEVRPANHPALQLGLTLHACWSATASTICGVSRAGGLLP